MQLRKKLIKLIKKTNGWIYIDNTYMYYEYWQNNEVHRRSRSQGQRSRSNMRLRKKKLEKLLKNRRKDRF